MLEFCEKVMAYTDGLDKEEFAREGMVHDAVLRNLELIGEAATHIPSDIRERHEEIPWRLIVATRNRLIHGYLGIDEDVIWSIVTDEVPLLRQKLMLILEGQQKL